MFDPDQCAAYLERIGVSGSVRADLETLRRVHVGHATTMVYENLDIQLGRPVGLDTDTLFDKFVAGGRGGFCYENNGVLGAALTALGFPVTLLTGAVHLETAGERAWGNHVVLGVRVDGRDWLADGGLGTGFREPLPWVAGVHRQDGWDYQLDRLRDGHWRCRLPSGASLESFDFRSEPPARWADFVPYSRVLATDPESPFVTILTVQRTRPRDFAVLRSRTLRLTGPDVRDGEESRLLSDVDEFADVLTGVFGLDLSGFTGAELELLWRKACEQHEVWLSRQAG